MNGDANLQRAKNREATQAIDNPDTFEYTTKKTALKQQVTKQRNVSGVTDPKNKATSLDNADGSIKNKESLIMIQLLLVVITSNASPDSTKKLIRR